jgi:hypothetical protein
MFTMGLIGDAAAASLTMDLDHSARVQMSVMIDSPDILLLAGHARGRLEGVVAP